MHCRRANVYRTKRGSRKSTVTIVGLSLRYNTTTFRCTLSRHTFTGVPIRDSYYLDSRSVRMDVRALRSVENESVKCTRIINNSINKRVRFIAATLDFIKKKKKYLKF